MSPAPPPKMRMEGVSVAYGAKVAVKDVTMDLPDRRVTAFIGPSGCGKSTVLRCLNRMNDTVPGCVVTGRITLDDSDVLGPTTDVVTLRRRVGMVFQQPNPFPKSIRDNVAYGPRIAGLASGADLEGIVEHALRQAALWEEVSDRLDDPALGLSGGQQQRVCIARALAVAPEVLLLDEPTSALDPIATARIEELVMELKSDYAIVIVTHNMQQAQRVADDTAVFYLGSLLEHRQTEGVFDDPRDDRVRAYVQGAFG